ncbi:cobalt transporter [Pimelobacter simplex]|uniref:HoxN/HupN/NixA family nickel/cobalt transporter n=1 Tax=Nocardioides simplex TaxID=2045 RepID=UPI00366AA7DF
MPPIPPGVAQTVHAHVLATSTLDDRLLSLVQSPGFLPVAFVLAFAAGAAHAVGPGHGKSLAAAYLVGSDGKVRDAAWLGVSVAVMHTVSVLVIALAWTFLSLSDLLPLEQLTSGLQLVAGVLVIGVGVWLFRRHLRGGGHGHGHGHGQDHEHRPSRPGLVLLGISGGLTPSPAAFLVLVTGIFAGRSGFALLLVITFGLGLATVLFGVGLLALAGRSVVVRAAESRAVLAVATRVAPVLAAVSVTVIGCVVTTLAVGQLVVAT